MSWHNLLNELDVTKGKVTKVSPDGNQVTIKTSPGQELKIDAKKDPNIDISTSGGKTSIKLNKKSGPNVGQKIKPGQSVDVEEGFGDNATATQALRLMVGSQNFAKAKRALEMARAGKSVPANFVSGLIPLLDLLDNVMSGSIANTRILQQLDKRAKQKLNIADSVNEAGGNMEGYLNTIDEYVEMLFKSAEGTDNAKATEIAYRIQNAVDDIRTRELGLKPSLIRAKYNKQTEAVQKKRLVDTGLDLEEGPNDKHIFKAIFMAGGPGSGKSFVAQKVLKQFGLKFIDSDKMFEYLMAKKGMDVNDPEQIYSPDGQATRDQAKAQTDKQKHWWLDGKLGVVIDGTGRDLEKTARIRQEMIDQGYGTMMLYVNTKLAVSQQRNLDRPGRTIRPEEVEKMWRRVQENIMKFQQLFGADRFLVIDNSGGLEDPERAEAFKNVESNIRKFLNQEPRNKIAQKWLAQYKK